MQKITYENRQHKIFAYLADQQLDAAVIEDTEPRRDAALRYLSGMPADALLICLSKGKSLLIPWDSSMAKRMAFAHEIIPYTDFGRSLQRVIPELLKREGIQLENAKIELPAQFPYPLYKQLQKSFPHTELICRTDGVGQQIKTMRMIKDAEEIELIKTSARITNTILTELAQGLKRDQFATELELAMFIEKAAREAGGEGTGFDTLVAGPQRSFGIHAFPTFTQAPLNQKGLTIIDFGIKYQGYTSDVTLTVVRGKPNEKQREMVRLVKQAYELALAGLKVGTLAMDLNKTVQNFFKQHGYFMPHALGHGIGLEAHEAPLLRDNSEIRIARGMVLAIEPGLYSAEAGGARYENDILIGENGSEVLTSSLILQLP